MNKIISYGWGVDLPIGKFVHKLHTTILVSVQKKYQTPVLVDTTWLGDENINEVYTKIKQINPDVIILCSLIDATFIYDNDFKQFDTKVISVGNFNNNNRIDFWSLVLFNRYIEQDTTLSDITYPFLCYNNKPHPHRMQLRLEFEKLDLIGKGAISFGGDNPVLSPENYDNIAYEESGAGDSLLNDTMTLGDTHIWNTSFINIITETEFNPVGRMFYSEKTWKPIIGMRPFLHYTSDNVNKELRSFGFKTFENVFSDICDLDLNKHSSVALFCDILSKQSKEYIKQKYISLIPTLKHNYEHFFKFAKQQNDKLSNIHC